MPVRQRNKSKPDEENKFKRHYRLKKGYSPELYAQSIFRIALERDELDTWQSELTSLSYLGNDVELMRFFTDDKITLSEKIKVLSAVQNKINPLALNLISLLISNNDLHHLKKISDEYETLKSKHDGFDNAEIITAVALEDDEIEELKKRMEQLTGKKLLIRTGIDPEIIGGSIVKIDGKLIDGSIRNRLNLLRKQLQNPKKK